MVVGCLFLVAAAFAVDWVVDSMSTAETRALSTMYSEGSVPHQDMAKGFFFRVTLFSGAYVIFCICLALLLFLLVAAIPIFLQDDKTNTSAREIILFAGGYYAWLVLLKMLTTTLPRMVWWGLTLLLGSFLLGNLWSLLRLLKIII
jgi:hypothetical protein